MGVSGGSHSRRRPVSARVFLWRVSDVAGGFRRHDSATLEPCSVSTAPDETLRRAGASKFGCPGLLVLVGEPETPCAASTIQELLLRVYTLFAQKDYSVRERD